jgi:hypothetical protein
LELTELAKRLDRAEVSVNARSCRGQLDAFGDAVGKSYAVIARSLGVIADLIEDERVTYTEYHKKLAAGALLPNGEFDQVRVQFENAIFPNFYQEILWGCLSLDGKGLTGYGPYAMTLKENLIRHRTTVFEENPAAFSKRHGILLAGKIPAGYRAVWDQRGDLAKAKLHPKIDSRTTVQEFASILMSDNGTTDGADFVEAHVFGPINRHTVEKVVGPIPRSREDKLVAKRLGRLLKNVGAKLELF